MVGPVSNLLPRVKTGLACGCRGHSQIANADIDADDVSELCRGWVSNFDGQGHKQIELLTWLIVPEFGIPNRGPFSNECRVFGVALVGNTDTSVERPDADPAVALKGVVALISVLHSWGTVVRRLVQT